MNFYVPSYVDDLLKHLSLSPVEEEFGESAHPETGRPIAVSFRKTCDLSSQTETYSWSFEYDGQTTTVPMKTRWIHTEEFQLLLRLAGFDEWELYGSHTGDPYVGSSEITNAYWCATKLSVG